MDAARVLTRPRAATPLVATLLVPTLLVATLLRGRDASAEPVGAPDSFDAYLDAPVPAADRFVDPLRGGAAGPVVAPARGRVVEVGADFVVLEHLAYENHHRRLVRSTLSGLARPVVAQGARIEAGTILADASTSPRVVFEVAQGPPLPPRDLEPARFVAARGALFVPHDEPLLVVVDHASMRAAIVRRGRVVERIAVSFGQAEGEKRVQGDLKTPKGMYFVVHKHRGSFDGPVGPYYGGHWIKISYPNAYDAARGVDEGLISAAQGERIGRAWRARALPFQGSKLGGGIGFHGWIEEWPDDGPRRLSWGCVVLHNRDIARLYDEIPVGAMVVLL